ncbi:signal peptide peptidase SppA [bacterium]|nr:signal peptide peptidase SppA [bacterium]
MKKTDLIAAGIILFLIVWAFFNFASDKGDNSSDFGERIAIIPLKGVIIDSAPFIKNLTHLASRNSVKGIIILINSPGGGTTASEEIYLKIKRISKKYNKPVFASISTVGASGGYFAALAADMIWALPSSLTGSIGVIMDLPQWSRLMNELGLDLNRFRSGDLKGSGSPWKELSSEEKKYFQSLIDDIYSQFLDITLENRNLTREELLPLARGQAFTGKQAWEKGLIDELGPLQSAVDSMASLLDLDEDPKLIYPKKEKLSLFNMIFDDINGIFSQLNTSPTLQMIYK